MTDFSYVGTELDLFAAVLNWKRYVRSCIEPWLGLEVLEVGAGFGGTTRVLCKGTEKSWVCLEPDPALVSRLETEVRAARLPGIVRAVTGTIETLPASARFDTILYMDVLEHMENDSAELLRAAQKLIPGGHLIVLSPAHQWLYSPFDQAIGHYRRYSKATLVNAAPRELELVALRYLDSVGLLASLGNRLVLRSSMPTASQLAFWDKVLVPVSTVLDRVLFHAAGKSVLAVWRRVP